MCGVALVVWFTVITNTAAQKTAAPSPECVLESWSPWGDCVTPADTPATSRDVKGVVTEIDEGRAAMALLRGLKEREWAQQRQRSSSDKSGFPGRRARCRGGRAAIYPCMNADLSSSVSNGQLDPSGRSYEANDMWGWTDDRNDDYAIVGMDRGTTFLRVTNPYRPEVLGHLPSATDERSAWRDIKVVGHHAYIVSEAAHHGMQVFDLRQLQDLKGNPSRVFAMSAFYDGVSNTHNLVANEDSNTVFLVGTNNTIDPMCNGGLHMVDVSDPLNPMFVGCYGGDGYVHDAQCVTYSGPDARYHGREVCFCYNEDSFTIVDVTDRASGVIISKSVYEGVAYTHQGWCTEDVTIAVMDDELDEYLNPTDSRTRTYVWDIRDLQVPVLKKVHMHSVEAIDHNQYVKGDYTYQSNYNAGLRVLHINRATYGLTEVAFFDIYPAATYIGFTGSWSNYPYFRNGQVGVTSKERGFFMINVLLPGTPLSNGRGSEGRGVQSTVEGRGLRRRDRSMIDPSTDSSSCPDVALEEFKTC